MSRLAFLAVFFLSAFVAAAQDEPDANLRQAHEWRRENQPALDALLAAPSPKERAEAVRRFLRKSAVGEAPTPVILDLDATICSPSERLMLIDRLGGVVGPLEKADAIEIARALLDSKSPEERIVALRNLARLSPEDRPFVAKSLRGIIRESVEKGDASFAFGQAFDGIVYLRDVDSIPLLVELFRDETNAPLAGATLDRLATAAPSSVATYLGDHPAILDGFPLLRADYYAKGSLASDDYRALVEKYLRSPAVDDREAEKFFFSYLQGGAFLVSGIFTGEAPVPPEGPDRAAELKAAVDRWEKNPAMRKAVEAHRSVWRQIDAEPAEATPR